MFTTVNKFYEDSNPNIESEDAGKATAQMPMKMGLKLFGQSGVDAVKKEMAQLHERGVTEAKDPIELTQEQKHEALAYLMFLKCKSCGKVKGCGCADGHKQRAYIT